MSDDTASEHVRTIAVPAAAGLGTNNAVSITRLFDPRTDETDGYDLWLDYADPGRVSEHLNPGDLLDELPTDSEVLDYFQAWIASSAP